VQIVLSRCTLREWRDGDRTSLVRHADNPRVARGLRDAFPQPYGVADADRWIKSTAGSDPQTIFAIDVAGEACGGIGLHVQADVFRSSAEIGYWLGERYWGRGIATESVRASTKYAFDGLGLEHVYATVFENNPASARVLEKAGYEQEGRLRRHVTKGGVTMDVLLYGIVRPPADPRVRG
jgi:ribosomal-protein-alanine N-acetyltransferase